MSCALHPPPLVEISSPLTDCRNTAPVVYLHGQDPYLPSDLNTHISHTTPEVNFKAVSAPSPLDLNTLNQLGGDVYLTSNDDITTNPDWIKGIKPDANGKTEGATAAVIVNDKGNGNVDAFYMCELWQAFVPHACRVTMSRLLHV